MGTEQNKQHFKKIVEANENLSLKIKGKNKIQPPSCHKGVIGK